MTPDFWTERWQKNDIGLHQKSVHDLLQAHWPALGVASDAAVLVPLAGKSLDMVWLAEQGHGVLGIELSMLAVESFFAERHLSVVRLANAAGTLIHGGPYAMICGDFFAVPPDVTAHIGAVYDRAALVALPPGMRQDYARHLMALTPAGAKMLLIALDYDGTQMSGPPFPVPPAEVETLFQPHAQVRVLQTREVIGTHPHFAAKGIGSLVETAYLIEKR